MNNINRVDHCYSYFSDASSSSLYIYFYEEKG